jgi:hypothetical protein
VSVISVQTALGERLEIAPTTGMAGDTNVAAYVGIVDAQCCYGTPMVAFPTKRYVKDAAQWTDDIYSGCYK